MRVLFVGEVHEYLCVHVLVPGGYLPLPEVEYVYGGHLELLVRGGYAGVLFDMNSGHRPLDYDGLAFRYGSDFVESDALERGFYAFEVRFQFFLAVGFP